MGGGGGGRGRGRGRGGGGGGGVFFLFWGGGGGGGGAEQIPEPDLTLVDCPDAGEVFSPSERLEHYHFGEVEVGLQTAALIVPPFFV